MLSNLRFADDILLIGRSLPQIKQMIADVAIEGAKVGLKLHPEKTKIQHNNMGYGSHVKRATINGMSIEVLAPTASAMYLGRALSLTETHDVELNHRLKKAWAKFSVYRQELTDKDIPLYWRLKLFDTVVTPTVLYGCSSWVMTCAREASLRSAQMHILRKIVGRRRLVKQSEEEMESWVDWIQRVTEEVRQLMKRHDLQDWIELQRCQQLKWGARLEQLDQERWSRKVVSWTPSGARSRGHPRTRWRDQMDMRHC